MDSFTAIDNPEDTIRKSLDFFSKCKDFVLIKEAGKITLVHGKHLSESTLEMNNNEKTGHKTEYTLSNIEINGSGFISIPKE